ncbi:hypothetical protein M427DRAFT_43291 [Gonapodya prolifera JEL478]|uniref:Uncharacterized protein n=1 Tax=Gonapodya prolifera (strain JEL478) TaxID=1344416 RepID=A0A139AKJ8_GONPJ|nr:hypothetical protein M427DRAFT_43291 [Gonapodya prolifera JEL478]|eukprot:KXS17033.1 hypothetical protein M427DRAFT_43291 [Gonapodya prolifera JEL478]
MHRDVIGPQTDSASDGPVHHEGEGSAGPCKKRPVENDSLPGVFLEVEDETDVSKKLCVLLTESRKKELTQILADALLELLYPRQYRRTLMKKCGGQECGTMTASLSLYQKQDRTAPLKLMLAVMGLPMDSGNVFSLEALRMKYVPSVPPQNERFAFAKTFNIAGSRAHRLAMVSIRGVSGSSGPSFAPTESTVDSTHIRDAEVASGTSTGADLPSVTENALPDTKSVDGGL